MSITGLQCCNFVFMSRPLCRENVSLLFYVQVSASIYRLCTNIRGILLRYKYRTHTVSVVEDSSADDPVTRLAQVLLLLLLLLLYLSLLPCNVVSSVHCLKAILSRARLFISAKVFPFLLATSITQSSQVFLGLPLPPLFSLLASIACFGFL